MRKSIRKLIGTVVLLVFVMTYALIAMALAEGRILQAPEAVKVTAYIVLGLAWVLPVMPLIRWMEKPDPDSAG